MRRAAMRLMPFLLLCYFISFLDRINVAFAALQMNKDIGLTTAQYGLGAGLFFLTYCLFEIPSNLMLFRVGVPDGSRESCSSGALCRRHGIRCRSLQFLHNAIAARRCRSRLLPRRFVLPDAVVSHGLSGSHSQPVHGRGGDQRVVRRAGFGLFSCRSTAGFGLRGWQWLFIIEGVPAILLAPMCLDYLQDGPAQAPGGSGRA